MRHKFSKSERHEILSRYGSSCVLCNKLFILADLHHVIYLCLGGPDTTDNVVPLCPTCHRIIHKYHQVIAPKHLSDIANKKVGFAKNERLIVTANPYEAASLLLSNSTLVQILCFGAYSRYYALAQNVIGRLSTKKAYDKVLAAKLELFCAEMALYLNSESDVFQRAESSLTQLKNLTNFDTSSIIRGNLIVGRLAGRTGQDSLELRYLSNAYPSANDKAWETREWQFRMLAYFKKHKQVDDFKLLMRDVGEFNHTEDEIIRSNILSELGRVQFGLGRFRDALNTFREVLTISFKSFHRRGIFLTSLFLTECELMIEEYGLAAKYLLIASQFSSCSIRPVEHAKLDGLRIRLEQAAGTGIVCAYRS